MVEECSFWKSNMKNYPGQAIRTVIKAPAVAQSAAIPTSFSSQKHTQFNNFENGSSSAWESDDTTESWFNSAGIKLSASDIHKSASELIETHRSNVEREEPAGPRPSRACEAAPRLFISGNPVISDKEQVKLKKLTVILTEPTLNTTALKEICWSGIPAALRPKIWKLLSGYLPAQEDRRDAVLERKRTEYLALVQQHFQTRHQDNFKDTYRQIHIDIPRMNPAIGDGLFQQERVQALFERILFLWAVRHPASGYVQGMNDLVTPFFIVFLTEFMPAYTTFDTVTITKLSDEQLSMVEADCFWCLSRLLDSIQDHYTFAQEGIQRKVRALADLMTRVNLRLHQHLEAHSIEYLQFAFRWMNNLLSRELPLPCLIRLWDTYLAEQDGFASFHLYVCAAFFNHFADTLLKENDFHGLMLKLQNLPTINWQDSDVALILAEAFKLQVFFADSPNHLSQSSSR